MVSGLRFLRRPYGQVDRIKLQRTLLQRCIDSGVVFHLDRVSGATHSGPSSQLLCTFILNPRPYSQWALLPTTVHQSCLPSRLTSCAGCSYCLLTPPLVLVAPVYKASCMCSNPCCNVIIQSELDQSMCSGADYQSSYRGCSLNEHATSAEPESGAR